MTPTPGRPAILFALLVFVAAANAAMGQSLGSFSGHSRATLEILSISAEIAGFRISVINPDDLVVNDEAAGTGDFIADTSVTVDFHGADVNNLTVGDRITTETFGAAELTGPASTADIFVLPSVTIDIDNDSGLTVTADFLLTYEMTVEAEVLDDDGNVRTNVMTDVSLIMGTGGAAPTPDPFFDALALDAPGLPTMATVTDTHELSFPVPPGNRGQINLSNVVFGDATAPLPGDFNDDGLVDGLDFIAWQRGESPDPLSASDLAIWEAEFAKVSVAAEASVSVPEPQALRLLVAFGIMLLVTRRQKAAVKAGKAAGLATDHGSKAS